MADIYRINQKRTRKGERMWKLRREKGEGKKKKKKSENNVRVLLLGESMMMLRGER